MKLKVLISCSVVAFAAVSTPAHAQVEIQWWHAMPTALGEWVNDLAKDFNASQKEYRVITTFKGSYDESMTAAIAAFRSGNAPHILQVFEVGTATMMASKGAIIPVGKVMADAGQKFDPKIYVPACRRLLHGAERPDAELPVQQLDAGLPLQQGRLQGRRPRPGEATEDLARR
jgi:sn-glycerol 3-phosphate transport system substrate-binding protein